MVTYTKLTEGINSSAFSSITTASVAPDANTLILITVVSKIASSDPNEPTASGLGLTWTQHTSVLQDGSQHVRVTILRALSTTAITGGTVTINFGGQNQDSGAWAIVEYQNVVTTGSNGADAIVQTVTSSAGSTTTTVTLSSFSKNVNATLGVIGSLSLGTTYNLPSGFTQVSRQTSAETIIESDFFNGNDTSLTWTQNGSTYPTAAIAMEIGGRSAGFLGKYF